MYLTVKEAAQKWGINERRVRLLCQENRIEGLKKEGKKYMIPENASKPNDLRGKRVLKQITYYKYLSPRWHIDTNNLNS